MPWCWATPLNFAIICCFSGLPQTVACHTLWKVCQKRFTLQQFVQFILSSKNAITLRLPAEAEADTLLFRIGVEFRRGERGLLSTLSGVSLSGVDVSLAGVGDLCLCCFLVVRKDCNYTNNWKYINVSFSFFK